MYIHSLPLDPLAILARHYPPGSAAFALLVRHSREVTDWALTLARAKPALDLDEGFLLEAAMLHDIGIFLTDAPEIHCYGREPYIKHGVLGGDLLRRYDLPYHARVAERHTSSGLTHEEIRAERLPLPLDRSYLPESLEEQLICYADCFYSKTHPGERKSPEAISRKMAKQWRKYGLPGIPQTVVRFERLHALFGLT